MDCGTLSAIIDIDESADRLAPLESGFDIGLGQVPAAFIPFSRTVTMDGPKPVSLRTESCPLGTSNTGLFDSNPIRISGVSDRSYPGYEEVPFIASKPIDGSEVLIGVSFAALAAELGE